MANTVAVSNYLVPATGSTNAYPLKETFVPGTPKLVDFNSAGLDGIPFRPSGVIIDNSQGVGTLRVLINEISYAMNVPAGGSIQMQYPAPVGHTATITGDGLATVVFVDYPIIPFDLQNVGSQAISIGDGDDVALGSTTDAAALNTVDPATLIALTKMLAQIAVGFDADGDPLPLTFDFEPRVMTYLAGVLQTEAVTIGATTWTKTYTYTGSDLTGISAWVK